MNLPIVKMTKYDLLMNNIPVTFASDECLVVLEDTGEVFHWEPNKYLDDIWTNARIDMYSKLIKQITPAIQNNGYTVDINGKIERPYENIGYSDRTTSSYKYTGFGDSTCSYSGSEASSAYLSDRMTYFYPHFEFTKSNDGVWKIIYEIQPGDTLSEIAKAAGSSLEKILQYNPQIENPNKIMAYDWINLPTSSIVEPEKFAYEFNQRKKLLKNKTIAELRYTSRKEAIDTYSRMTLKVDDKQALCLACGRFIHTPKIGKYNGRYCDNCGCYMPELMFGKE